MFFLNENLAIYLEGTTMEKEKASLGMVVLLLAFFSLVLKASMSTLSHS